MLRRFVSNKASVAEISASHKPTPITLASMLALRGNASCHAASFDILQASRYSSPNLSVVDPAGFLFLDAFSPIPDKRVKSPCPSIFEPACQRSQLFPYQPLSSPSVQHHHPMCEPEPEHQAYQHLEFPLQPQLLSSVPEQQHQLPGQERHS